MHFKKSGLPALMVDGKDGKKNLARKDRSLILTCETPPQNR
jgi:hypothetical protein